MRVDHEGVGGWGRLALGAVVSTWLLLGPGPMAHATPPTVVLVWLDEAGLRRAAAAFDAEAGRAFAAGLSTIRRPGQCGASLPRGFECVEPWGLLRALPALVCPAVQANRPDRVETLFKTVERQRLARGSISGIGVTAVSFELTRDEGRWTLAEVHRPVEGGASARSQEFRMALACPVSPVPTGVTAVPGAALAVPTAVLVDVADRIWIGHRPGFNVTRRGGVIVYERGVWRDASGGLDGEVEALHATPAGELFASGRGAAWRWENGAWVRRLSSEGCVSPLHLTSLGPLLFGVCAYYPHYVAWPTRKAAEVQGGPFLADVVDRVAALADGEIFAIGEAFQVLLRLPAGGDVHAPGEWQRVAVPVQVGERRFRASWSPAPGRLAIMGEKGLVLQHERGQWTVDDPGVAENLLAVWGTEADGLYVAGAAGRLLHRGPGGWRVIPTGTTESLIAVHGRPAGRVVVLSAGGSVLEVAR